MFLKSFYSVLIGMILEIKKNVKCPSYDNNIYGVMNIKMGLYYFHNFI